MPSFTFNTYELAFVFRLELVPVEDHRQSGEPSADNLIEAQIPAQQYRDMGLKEGDMLVVTPRKARVFVEG